MIDQGLAFTAVVRSADGSGEGLDQAVKFWFGAAQGTDWLHSAIERELSDDVARYQVRSSRDSIHIGAAGEVLEVVLTLLGGGAAALAVQTFGAATDRAANSALDAVGAWAKEKVARHREAEGLEQADGPPDLVNDREPRDLARRLREDLAALLGLEVEAVKLVSASRDENSIWAVYRVDSGETYDTVVCGNQAEFTRRTAAAPAVGSGEAERERVPLLPWRRRSAS